MGEGGEGRRMLISVSSPADVIFSALLNDKVALNGFIKTNQSRLAEAQAYTRGWFQDRGVTVADSNAYVVVHSDLDHLRWG